MRTTMEGQTGSVEGERSQANSPVLSSAEELGYNAVIKSGKNLREGREHSYISVIKYVSDVVADDFSLLKDLQFFLNVFDSAVAKKLIFLTLHSTKVYSNLAQKVLKIQHNEFQRAVAQLAQLQVLEPVSVSDANSDPFLRWAKRYSPNLSVSRIKLYKLNSNFSTLCNKIESHLEAAFDRETADEIKHFRFAIKRTHRDILREKKLRVSEQRKLQDSLKKNVFAKEKGNCCSCQALLYEVEASRKNPTGTVNYRERQGRLYCNSCFKQLFLDSERRKE